MKMALPARPPVRQCHRSHASPKHFLLFSITQRPHLPAAARTVPRASGVAQEESACLARADVCSWEPFQLASLKVFVPCSLKGFLKNLSGHVPVAPSIILTTWVAEFRRIEVQSQPGQNCLQDPISKKHKTGLWSGTSA
jgi:hypothetical protein